MPTLIQDKTGIFYIVYTVRGKRVWRTTGTRNRTRAYTAFLKASTDTSPVIHQTKAPLLSKCAADFLDYVKANLSPKTLSTYELVLKRFREHFGKIDIDQIGTREMDFYKIDRSKKVSPSSVNIELRGIKAFFNCLKRWEIISRNPCEGIKFVRLPQQLPAYLTEADLNKLINSLEDEWLRKIVIFAAMTGARLGEVMNLDWKDVNLTNRTALIHSSISYTVKGGRMRSVPLNSTVYELLMKDPNKDGLVFPGKRGGDANLNFVSASFRKAVRKAGIDRRIHFHSLRHTFASLLVKNGVSLYQVQKLLGHTTSRVSEIYAHLQTGDLHEVVDIINLNPRIE
jgi:integrase/recombinase XerD